MKLSAMMYIIENHPKEINVKKYSLKCFTHFKIQQNARNSKMKKLMFDFKMSHSFCKNQQIMLNN